MSLKNSLHFSLVASALALACLSLPTASQAAKPKKHVKCEITTDSKTETKMVASADECTKLGGKVVPPKHK